MDNMCVIGKGMQNSHIHVASSSGWPGSGVFYEG